jgi:hypothetical protein
MRDDYAFDILGPYNKKGETRANYLQTAPRQRLRFSEKVDEDLE